MKRQALSIVSPLLWRMGIPMHRSDMAMSVNNTIILEYNYTFNQSNNAPEYHFHVTDHLGNVRAVLNENNAIEEINHYYPYGTLFGESTGLSNSTQPYKYTGKELDRMHGLDLHDHGARWSDTNLGRWWKMDPLAEKYTWMSPYVLCADNPLKYVDPNGEDNYTFFRSIEERLASGAFSDEEIHGVIKIYAHGVYEDKYDEFAMGISIPDGRNDRVIDNAEDFKVYILDTISEWQNNNPENSITIEVHACGTSKIIEEFSKSAVFKDYNIIWKAPDSVIGVRNNGESFLHPVKYFKRDKNGQLIDLRKGRKGHWHTYETKPSKVQQR